MDANPGSGARPTGPLQRAEREARVRSSGIGLPAHPANAIPRSGCMPDARGLVLCPYCRKTYPYSQALLNRQLRCSGCKAVFRVAEDRRSFRVQDAPPPPKPETKRISRSTKAALQEANDSLKEIANQALRQLSSRDQPHPSSATVPAYTPKAEGTSASGAPVTAAPSPTNRLTKTPRSPAVANKPKAHARDPVLSGAGDVAGRQRRGLWLTVGALALVGVLIGWSLQPDQRRTALWTFQAASQLDQPWASRVAELHRRSLSGTVAPIVAIDRAALGAVITVPVEPLRTALGTLRQIGHQDLWVDGARLGEATALFEKTDLTKPNAMQSLVARCSKAGIEVRTTDDLLTAAQSSMPPGAENLWQVLLNAPAARGGTSSFDSAALLNEGKLPDSVSLTLFAGKSGNFLQPAGPPKTVAYRGRLIRCTGPGWPNEWRVLDLEAVGRE